MKGKAHKHSDRQADYWIHITNKCNWFCDYCLADTHNTNEVDFSKLTKVINNIKNKSLVSLTGGEVGILPPEKINTIFNILNNKQCDICIDTNGTFIENYPEYYNKVVDYFYHCSEKLDNTIKEFNDPDNKITYMIVVSDSNFENAFEFIENNSDYLLHVHGAMSNGNKGDTLSRKNAFKLFKFCARRNNINQEHLKYILDLYSAENKNNYLDSRL